MGSPAGIPGFPSIPGTESLAGIAGMAGGMGVGPLDAVFPGGTAALGAVGSLAEGLGGGPDNSSASLTSRTSFGDFGGNNMFGPPTKENIGMWIAIGLGILVVGAIAWKAIK